MDTVTPPKLIPPSVFVKSLKARRNREVAIDPIMVAQTSEAPLTELELSPAGRMALLVRVEAAARELALCAVEACKHQQGPRSIQQFRGMIEHLKDSISARVK